MPLQTDIIHWKKIKETHRKMFSGTNYMEQDLQKSSGIGES